MSCNHEHHDAQPGTAYGAAECIENGCDAWRSWPHQNVDEVCRDITRRWDWEPREEVVRVDLWLFDGDVHPESPYWNPNDEVVVEQEEIGA